MHLSLHKLLITFSTGGEASRTVITSIHLSRRHQGHPGVFIILHILE